MKRFNKFCFGVGVLSLLATGLLFFLSGEGPVLFESAESKTVDGGSVFNRVNFFRSGHDDIWLMQQSHHGNSGNFEKWDRLAILVNREKKTVQFYQLRPGELNLKEAISPIKFRVSCFLCHPNGPRVIRPEWNSRGVSLSLADQAKLSIWNLRIKSYGVLDSSRLHRDTKHLKTPFRYSGKLENDPLDLKTCNYCHRKNGFLSRGELTRQNALAIQFMVNQKIMPPFGFNLAQNEKAKLEQFLNGF